MKNKIATFLKSILKWRARHNVKRNMDKSRSVLIFKKKLLVILLLHDFEKEKLLDKQKHCRRRRIWVPKIISKTPVAICDGLKESFSTPPSLKRIG